MRKLISIFALMGLCLGLGAQERGDVVEQADGYQWPTDAAVLEKLDAWQDLKFGVLLHWGLYSIPGIVESWNLCNEDWVVRPEGSKYEEYKQWYWGLSKDFNPVDFNPSQWAKVCADAGMKYVIFTTKHHDGFCLFDSEYTDFKANGDYLKGVLDAYRAHNFMIGTYFSKPDWHHEGFWNPYYATPNRMPNYKKEKHPEWWNSYVEYTQNQLQEITGGRYGKLDILWLDGGWITGDEVGLNELLSAMRAKNPGLICVDRTIEGPNENYQTPEQMVPDRQINHPWESCISLGNDWGWTPENHYKSAQRIINTLAQITAKGGCMVLGVGPTASGIIEDKAVVILEEIGSWMRRNGEAIYNTRPTAIYNDGDIWFNASKDGKTLYAIYALPEGSNLPATLSWSGNSPAGKVTLLSTGKKLKTSIKDGKTLVTLPKNLPNEPIALKFETK